MIARGTRLRIVNNLRPAMLTGGIVAAVFALLWLFFKGAA